MITQERGPPDKPIPTWVRNVRLNTAQPEKSSDRGLDSFFWGLCRPAVGGSYQPWRSASRFASATASSRTIPSL